MVIPNASCGLEAFALHAAHDNTNRIVGNVSSQSPTMPGAAPDLLS